MAFTQRLKHCLKGGWPVVGLTGLEAHICSAGAGPVAALGWRPEPVEPCGAVAP